MREWIGPALASPDVVLDTQPPAQPHSSVVSCHVPVRTVSAWMCSTTRLMLFFDGRYPRRAWPVLAEYICPNVYPRKSNSSPGTLQIRVFSSFTTSFSFPM